MKWLVGILGGVIVACLCGLIVGLSSSSGGWAFVTFVAVQLWVLRFTSHAPDSRDVWRRLLTVSGGGCIVLSCVGCAALLISIGTAKSTSSSMALGGVGILIALFGVAVLLVGCAVGIALIFSGRLISRKRSRREA